eukprot:TRINITY_DN2105_c0_g1_i1.p1 TRINITY_DN2105_c0_g1~~TRINITY_DN2105_c0_g1_i1.p1  ORF type:complete len:324 (-),score=52.27 TRINITY_DN2105_c0_g1_i1:53-1024(-)
MAQASDELIGLAQLGLTTYLLFALGRIGGLFNCHLVLEIVCGLIVQTDVLGVAPFPDAIVLIGKGGLVLLVMEGGLSIDLASLPRAGPIALVVAVVGTVLPCLLGVGFMYAFGYTGTHGVAAGTALSSTSIGMATKMLQNLGQLHTPLGSLICVAAMVDDVLSLVILAVLSNVKGDNGGLWGVLEPIVVSVIVIVLGALSVRFTPVIMQAITSTIDDTSLAKLVNLVSMLLVTFAFTLGSGFAGSTYLLGAFCGGMSFINVPGVHDSWSEHSSVSEWLSSVFFLSIGLQIPAKDLFSFKVMGLGILYTIPPIAGKLVRESYVT